ncbi:MAG: DUF4175 domain-containing protein [Alphaproteobacteria bacterium]
MLDPYEKQNRPYFAKLARKKRAAYKTLWLEKIILHTWRPFFWTVLFCGLWMISIPEFFGRTIEILTAIIFFTGVIILIKKDIFTLTPPKRKDIDRFLERKSALPIGTIRAVQDKLSNPQKHITRDLWNDAQHKILHTLKHLKSPHIRAQLSREDPTALRYLAILFFICGIIISGNTWQYKITNGMFPLSPSFTISQGKSTNLWVTPPDYTQIPATQINTNNNEKLQIPEGSKIRIRMHNTLGELLPPTLINGDQKHAMDYMEGGLYGIETTIAKGNTLAIKQGLISRASWKYDYIIDTPPEIMFDLPPATKTEDTDENTEPVKQEPYKIIEKGQISFPLIVKDNYGVKDLKMVMNIDKIEGHIPLGDPTEETRLVMSQPNNAFKIIPVYDMTWHSWAGLPVTFEYTAIDHKGQTATLEKIHLTLPERTFKHPMAQSLISMRKRLAWDYDESFMDISQDLQTLLSAPNYFQHDKGIFLAIRTASSRLHYTDNARQPERIKAAKAVISLLWDIAITIEDGNLSLAMRELRDARRALENALRDSNSSEDEISRLMDNLREKMQQYFMEMQRDLQKRMAQGEEIPMLSPEDYGQMISPDAISELMAEIESALREGDEQKAQELMSKLQRMMEMLDPNMSAQMPQDMQMMQEGINELQELIERQQSLIEQTKKQADAQIHKERFDDLPPIDMPSIKKMLEDFGIDTIPPAPTNPEPPPKDAAPQKNKLPSAKESQTEQEALRFILGQLMLDAAEKIEEIPEKMGKAEQEMRASSDKLGKDDPNASIPNQEQAVEYLKEAQEQLSEQLKQRMQQMIGIGLSGAPTDGNRDPLGRPRDVESDVKVPDENQKKRVDEILRTLRDRSGDRSRPDDELDYLRRLLQQF